MHNIPISIEFFPPHTTAGIEKLRHTRQTLKTLLPAFFSVTYGAGGSTQQRTFDTVFEIQQQDQIDVAPHVSCIGASRAQIRDILQQYQHAGIRRIVALRGDLPSGTADGGDLRYANELVEFIREETGDWFHIKVAAYPEYHPQARSPAHDLKAFKQKVSAGANSAITQYFYNLDAYLYFRDDCVKAGIDIPIIPGIMPIISFSKLARFSDSCGTEIPRWMRYKFESFGDDHESIRALGIDVVGALCERLIAQGVPGLHFYSMNQVEPTATLIRQLKAA